MVSKDQAIGGVILVVCLAIAVIYIVTLFYPEWLEVFGITTTRMTDIQFWVVAVPVFIAFVAIMGIGAWIGWTMATTPPPKPIEELTSEVEEKKEEKPEEKATIEEPMAETEEKKRPERKRKS